MSSPVTHVIFDCAGTLVDFFTNIYVLGQKFAERNGVEVKPEYFGILDKKPKLSNQIDHVIQYNLDQLAEFHSFDEGMSQFLKIVHNPQRDQIVEDFQEIKQSYYKEILDMNFNMIAGADKLVRHMYEHNIPMAIASNMATNEVKTICSQTNGFDFKYFSHFVGGADDPEVKNNKPAPDVFLVCAKRFSPPPKSVDNCIIFEDSKLGITGALASGMKTVLIKNRFSGECNDIEDKITAVVDSFEDFKPESVGLPPYKSD